MNKYSREKKAFLFILDFGLKNPIILPVKKVNPEEIKYDLNGISNIKYSSNQNIKIEIMPSAIGYDSYYSRFQNVQKEIHKGNTYLLNLTFKTKISLNASLDEIFFQSRAPYKLYLKDRFVVFSPESFIKIRKGKIYTYPMKGTAVKENNDSVQNLLNDPKESAEHATITDLLRNDLSLVAKNVKLEKYRYIDEINTGNKTILQVSTEISGELFPEYLNSLGDLFRQILPAGSVTGAPKKKTVEIIKATEDYERGYYTGVFGYFDGESLDSAVMIRFIEKEENQYFYKSGGGITFMSSPESEYEEYLNKIYVPVY
ncbi:MAG: aminodeoxychorismate synthase component I [Bacteroidales bacterium]|nr:aminodeoxychorismate synthase component I [Bacteroidales bacterium]MCF8391387.1 aminodeoxychorismate synthase component I [Bacteroidales bacterium]